MQAQPSAAALASESKIDLCAVGAEVIRTEAAALSLLAGSLGSEFESAVRRLSETQGRVIVSGMGKSGHIGRKIAATLASTGTPSFFVHPAEAGHGDLGMIVPGDLLLLLSNSGETPELGSLIGHGRRLGCDIVAIASRDASPLMRAADVRLLLPEAREACPVNIAPTTSTTLMLALGDALAVAVMRVRGVEKDTIRALHPGGAIGGRLQPVDAVMHQAHQLPMVAPGEPMSEVVIEMSRKGFGIAGVIEDGQLQGVITDGDLRRHSSTLFEEAAADVMTRDPVTISEGVACEEALAVMEGRRITALFVMACDAPAKPIGLVHIHDMARLGR